MCSSALISFFFFNDTATTEIYTLSLHDALPISQMSRDCERDSFFNLFGRRADRFVGAITLRRGGEINRRHRQRSEEHTSELQSPCNLVCRLLLEKKKKATRIDYER